MRFLLVFSLLFLTNAVAYAQNAEDFAKIWDKQHITVMPASQVRHKDLQKYLSELKSTGLKIEEVGRSNANREIYQVEWGTGATKVFMWSQMHGDEPTATSALIDMLAFLQKNRNKGWVKELEKALTIRAVPMLNPDGAELFQRRNLQGIDINRDARALQTPEGRLLKKLRDDWQPDIGFNLHNQNALTTVGKSNRQATISLLAVSGDPNGKSNAGHLRSRRISSVMTGALENFIKGNIGRYDDTYNPRAFGDMISAWGTPVILIETGALHGKDEMFLIRLNFVAYLAALKSIVDKSEQKANPNVYDTLPFNDSGNLYTAIFRKANIVNFAQTEIVFTGDVAINAERRRAGQIAPTSVQEIGDLSIVSGLDEYDASDFYLVPKNGLLKIGSPGEFLFYKKSRRINWKSVDLEKAFPPDAIFRNGKWEKGARFLPKTD
ncbi:MAG TPA: M14 family zinc carboxypeptidase [Pyrinomonadaceae bacterium]|nr:M14 family zinc carboxypeptidase [Pyrinomonadaceae bacterium]